MEYIHKAKAEKNRTKILSDQMDARRVKNKVCRTYATPVHKSNIRLPGCTRASCGTCCGEAVGDLGGRARSCCPGVNTYTPLYATTLYALLSSGSVTLSLFLCTRRALFVSYATHALYNQTPGCPCSPQATLRPAKIAMASVSARHDLL